jgi:hypothetical protein
MAFAGLGVGIFHVTALEAGVLAVVGVVLIVLGWPWSRRAPSSADLDDEPGESVNVEDVV